MTRRQLEHFKAHPSWVPLPDSCITEPLPRSCGLSDQTVFCLQQTLYCPPNLERGRTLCMFQELPETCVAHTLILSCFVYFLSPNKTRP